MILILIWNKINLKNIHQLIESLTAMLNFAISHTGVHLNKFKQIHKFRMEIRYKTTIYRVFSNKIKELMDKVLKIINKV